MKYIAILLIITSCVGLKKQKRIAESLHGEYELQNYIINGKIITLDSTGITIRRHKIKYNYFIKRYDKTGTIEIFLNHRKPKKDTLEGVIYIDDFARNIELHSSSRKIVLINPLLK